MVRTTIYLKHGDCLTKYGTFKKDKYAGDAQFIRHNDNMYELDSWLPDRTIVLYNLHTVGVD